MTLTNYDVNAVHGINKYLWNKLSTGATPVMDPARYANGLIPIIPVQQIPTFNNMTDQQNAPGGVPFIVYHYSTPALSQNFYVKMDHILYTVYSAKNSEVTRILGLIKNEMHRWDVSADDVNTYLASITGDPNYADFIRFNYKAISMVNQNGGLPTDSEGGRMSGTISLRASYTEDTGSFGLSPDGKSTTGTDLRLA